MTLASFATHNVDRLLGTAPSVRLTEMIRAQVGKNLVLARFARNVTQDALADASAISRATIAQIESGATDCRLSTLTEIAKALGITPVLLLLRETDITSLAQFLQKAAVETILARLPASQVERMILLRESGLQKNLLRVAQAGVAAAQAAGFKSPGAFVGASIGSALLPGLGTAIGTIFGAVLGNGQGAGAERVEDGGGI